MHKCTTVRTRCPKFILNIEHMLGDGECGKEVRRPVKAGWSGWKKCRGVTGLICDERVAAKVK